MTAPRDDIDQSEDGPPTSPAKVPAKRSKVIGAGKTQVTAYINAKVVDQARNAVLALMANPAGHRTLSALIEASIVTEIRRLELEYNNGRPFPARRVELQPGRPGGA